MVTGLSPPRLQVTLHPQATERLLPPASAETSTSRTVAPGSMHRRLGRIFHVHPVLPSAEEHPLDDPRMTGIELDMISHLLIASGASSPVGGAYHGLTPGNHSLTMLDALQISWR